MSNAIKQIIFHYKLDKCHKIYARLAEQLGDAYQQWIFNIETKEKRRKKRNEIKNLPKLSLSEFADIIRKDTDEREKMFPGWFAICLGAGDIEMPAGEWNQLFIQSSAAGMIYTDEDMKDIVSGKRYGAWFKPDHSPDTLLSFFYFGSLLFLKGMYVQKALEEFESAFEKNACSDRQCLYDFILFYTEFLRGKELTVEHIPQVLFHGEGNCYETECAEKPEVVNSAAYWGYEPEYDACKLAAIKRRGYQAGIKEVMHAGRIYHIPVYHTTQDKKVSIVIPSKDNVEVLTTCIKSIYENTEYSDFEIILVDNGSNDTNRKKLEILKAEYPFTYLYEPMDFNYSKMCNIGVAQAAGQYILLLNDDMEIRQKDWLTVMVGQAAVEGVGAVGAKLLYPDSDLIQHVGITNLWAGPAHKLLKEHDSVQDYYYGRNVLPYNMIGVTAAFLLVSKKKYLEVGGLCEEIAVSYNDVDFCFSLYDLGYRNVIRNDVVLFHHESLSRGDDTLSEAKWNRLLREKDFVYSKHPTLKSRDPYYNPNLAGYKHKYFCNFLYPYEQRRAYNSVKPFKGKIPPQWKNDCLMITLEHARMERKLDLKDENDIYWLEGWAYVLNMDNSRYKRTMLLIDEKEQMYEVSLYDRYRQDVVDILPEQSNIGVAGFSCRIKKEDLESGEYRVALLYRDCCSRQRLYKECDKKLVVQ
jgi:GT2 family glycosyltransferase